MDRFEHDYNRWLDGMMEADEARAFEKSLPADLMANKAAWTGVSAALARAAKSEAVPHADFLVSNVLAAIAPPATAHRAKAPSLFRLVWAGAACLAMAAGLAAWWLPSVYQAPARDSFVSRVLKAEAMAPGLAVYTFQGPDERSAIIWTEGVPAIPADRKVQ